MDAKCITNDGNEGCIHKSVGSPIEKRLLGSVRHRQEVNIQIDLNKYGVCVYTGFNWLKMGYVTGFV